MVEAQQVIPVGPELAPLHDAALPKDAPGAWIREALERMFTPGAPTDEARGEAS